MSFKTFSVNVIIIFSLLLSVTCQKVEKEKRVEKLETKVKFNPIKEHRGTGDAHFEVYIESNIGQPSARLHFQINDMPNYRDLDLKGDNLYVCDIPNQTKGTVANYYLEVTTTTGSKIFFPDNAEEGGFYTLVFKGEYNKFLWIVHIVLTIVSIVLFIIAAYFAFKHIKSGYPISKALWFAVIAFLFFIIGIFPIGMIIEYQVYGSLWDGWPFGSNFTHTTAFIMFIYWLAALFMMKNSIFKKEEKNLVTDRIFASLVIIGTIITVALFIIPHEHIRF